MLPRNFAAPFLQMRETWHHPGLRIQKLHETKLVSVRECIHYIMSSIDVLAFIPHSKDSMAESVGVANGGGISLGSEPLN